MLHVCGLVGVSPMDLSEDGGCCAGGVNPDGAGLDGSLAGGAFDVLDLIVLSSFEEAIDPGVGLLFAAQDVLGTVLVLPGLVLFGRGGTA
jgi:hypothetical protein